MASRSSSSSDRRRSSEPKRPRLASPQNREVAPLALFNAWRQKLLAQGAYLDLAALEQAQQRAYGGRLPSEIVDALGGLSRIMASTNSAVSTIFATHHVVTLRDIEAWVLSSSRDFAGLACFDQLLLGPLCRNPVVQRHLPRASTAPSHALALDSVAVLAHISDAMDAHRCSPREALDGLARDLGLRDASELPISIRTESYVGSLARRCIDARRATEMHMERQATQRGHAEHRREEPRGGHRGQRVPGHLDHRGPSGAGADEFAPKAAATSAAECLAGLRAAAAPSAAALLLAPDGAASSQLAWRAAFGLARHSDCHSAEIILDELQQLWSEDGLLGWALPQLSTVTVPVVEAKQLLYALAEGKGADTLHFPPTFNNLQRKELHAVANQLQLSTQSFGVGSGRHLVVSRKRALFGEERPPRSSQAVLPPKCAKVAQFSALDGTESAAATETGEASVDGSQPGAEWLRAQKQPKEMHQSVALAMHALGRAVVGPLVAQLVFAIGCLQTVEARGVGGADEKDKAQQVVAVGEGEAEVDAEMEEADGEAGAAAVQRRVAVVLDHLRSLADDDDGDDATDESPEAGRSVAQRSLALLARCEARLLHEREAPSFAALRLPQLSLVAFLAAHADPVLLTRLLPGADTAPGTQLQQLNATTRVQAARLLATLAAAAPDAPDAMLHDLLCGHFGPAVLGAAGLAKAAMLDELRRMHAPLERGFSTPVDGGDDSGGGGGAAGTRGADGRAAALPCASVLLARHAASRPAALANPLGELRAEHAARAIVRAPLLAPLDEATQWHTLFRPAMGELADFCAELRPSPPVLELAHGLLLRVEVTGPHPPLLANPSPTSEQTAHPFRSYLPGKPSLSLHPHPPSHPHPPTPMETHTHSHPRLASFAGWFARRLFCCGEQPAAQQDSGPRTAPLLPCGRRARGAACRNAKRHDDRACGGAQPRGSLLRPRVLCRAARRRTARRAGAACGPDPHAPQSCGACRLRGARDGS